MEKVRGIIVTFFIIVVWAFPCLKLIAQEENGKINQVEVVETEILDEREISDQEEGIEEDEIFNEAIFEDKIKESKAQEEKQRLETLIGADFIFFNSYSQPVDFNTYYMSSLFYGKVFSKATYPDIVSLFISYNFSLPVFQYTGNVESYTGYPSSVIYAELSEIFMSFDIYKKVFFRIGYQLIAWGPSVFWTPVDFINKNKVDPLSELDLRTGKPGAKIHFPFKGSNLFLFFDFSQSIGDNNITSSIVDKTRIGVRFDTILMGYELGLNSYIGKDLITLWGIDWSGVLLRTDFYGEVAISKGSNTPKLRLTEPPSTYMLYYPDEIILETSLGFSKSFGEFKYWTLRGEFFFNSNGYESDAPYSYLIAENLFTPLYMGKLYGYLSLTRSNLFTQNISGTSALLINVLDTSFDLYTTLSFNFPNLIPYNIRLSITGGEDEKEFTFWKGQAVTLSVYTKVVI